MATVINKRAHEECIKYFGNWVCDFTVYNYIMISVEYKFIFNKEILN